jgi:translation elongation factor EF-G
MQKMIKGLKLLSQADPCVDVFQQQTGEWVIMGAGELHLEVSISYSCQFRLAAFTSI